MGPKPPLKISGPNSKNWAPLGDIGLSNFGLAEQRSRSTDEPRRSSASALSHEVGEYLRPNSSPRQEQRQMEAVSTVHPEQEQNPPCGNIFMLVPGTAIQLLRYKHLVVKILDGGEDGNMCFTA